MGGKKSKLSGDELKGLETSTNFSAKEIKQLHKDFIRDSPSGHLRKEEFQANYSGFFPKGDPSKFASFIFNAFDANGDGTICFAEFITALSITSSGSLEEKLHWVFSLYDVDKNGFVTKAEMVEIVEAIDSMVDLPGDPGDTPAARVEKIFQQMDVNSDGKLSKEEFTKGSKSDKWIVQALSMGASQ